jgi:hypothetical protein
LNSFDLAEKNALTNLHWTLEQYEDADYFRLNEVLSAKEEEDMPVDPLSLIHR